MRMAMRRESTLTRAPCRCTSACLSGAFARRCVSVLAPAGWCAARKQGTQRVRKGKGAGMRACRHVGSAPEANCCRMCGISLSGTCSLARTNTRTRAEACMDARTHECTHARMHVQLVSCSRCLHAFSMCRCLRILQNTPRESSCSTNNCSWTHARAKETE